ncbi:MAG: OmpA family protein [Candidatus Marinimicrobia bacterium]|nr:OmpA family protein [Candidatus Neomarinimicrobiota bacterium]
MSDLDGDGIPDDKDESPLQAEDMDGFEDEDGVPDYDNDGDGILDVDDKCPNSAEDFDGFKDEDGCPEYDDDKDGDGIPDDKDKNPNKAEDFDGFEDEDGAPDYDNDGDGILDVDDKCPNAAEVFNGFEDEDGCPDEIVIEKDTPITLYGITFTSGSDILSTEAKQLLNGIVTALTDNTDAKIMISGYTDSVGSASSNKRLSAKRAISVKNHLISVGIKSNRMETEGLGEIDPVATNDTEEGRNKNRRIEIKRID